MLYLCTNTVINISAPSINIYIQIFLHSDPWFELSSYSIKARINFAQVATGSLKQMSIDPVWCIEINVINTCHYIILSPCNVRTAGK